MFKTDINSVIFSGNIGSIKHQDNCTLVSVAISCGQDDKGKNREPVWVSCTAFSNDANYIKKYADVGTPVIIEGRLHSYKETR